MDPQFIALTVPGLTHLEIPSAARAARAIGVVDLERVPSPRTANQWMRELLALGKKNCGVRVSVPQLPSLDIPDRIDTVLVVAGSFDPASVIGSLRTPGRTVLVEAISLESALAAEVAGADGIIVKGNEAGGWVGEETTFILLQRVLRVVSVPVWAQGGIGLHTAASCFGAGAAGIVLDVQLALARESSINDESAAMLSRMDGAETLCLGAGFEASCRVYCSRGVGQAAQLRRVVEKCIAQRDPEGWRQEIRSRTGEGVWLIGQESAFAAPLAARFRTVGGILAGFRASVGEHIHAAKRRDVLRPGAPLALSHGTKYPIAQGPMTRVSDTPAFARKVAGGGGLPFLALALMRGPEVAGLLEQAAPLLAGYAWGIGILGFVPSELRSEQMEVVLRYKPPFALIAGGRPDQTRALEAEGIRTYLHAPSPALLRSFLEDGARRFVFEGRECGGHVGPRSSFVLWDSMIDVLLESLSESDLSDCHVLFAGGIHDALSAAMVSVMAAPLADRGVRVGVLLGTAYLFTHEAVSAGAIVPAFQQEALRCDRTVMLQSGPGHLIRCVDTPYAAVFELEKKRLTEAGRTPDEIRIQLEELNVGRLRIASKGLRRTTADKVEHAFESLAPEQQRSEGMYMIGQLAALRDSVCSIAELHNSVSSEASERLLSMTVPEENRALPPRPAERGVAIIGMACLLPGAPNLQAYWENILNKTDSITEVPMERWDWRQYFSEDPKARDKVYSRWGGFLDEAAFDPLLHGMPPGSIPSIEPLQLLTLEVVRRALEDAGYKDRPFPRARTSVILGAGGGVADLGQQYAFRAALQAYPDLAPQFADQLPEWTEDSFPGILVNVAAGRVANRFDLGGVNYTVDAACASSLAAIHLAVRELEAMTSDVVIAGAADTVQNAFAFTCFSKTHALSPRGHCTPFDAQADGIAISEGVAAVVLKRLVDAERDGDRIYAVIRGVGGSSDGRGRSLTAPRPEGQISALERAYKEAGISPTSVGLIEAHGTGTVAGDKAEIEALTGVMKAAGAAPLRCALGSVKSNIGHTKCTAGMAGLIKASLALYHRTLPATIGVKQLNPEIACKTNPLFVNTETAPWLGNESGTPRRAGVSAFGFGGTNFHAVLEEDRGGGDTVSVQAPRHTWPAEVFVFGGKSESDFSNDIELVNRAIGSGTSLREVAAALWRCTKPRVTSSVSRLAVAAASFEELRSRLAEARDLNFTGVNWFCDADGNWFGDKPGAEKIAVVFPGQGSQYPGMLCELAVQFSELRASLTSCDRALQSRLPKPLSTYIYPPPSFSAGDVALRRRELKAANVAQPALGAVEIGLFRLLRSVGIRPSFLAGHSYGEYTALCASGACDEGTLFDISETRGRLILDSLSGEPGIMAAAEAPAGKVQGLIHSLAGVWIANRNSPRQTIVSGTEAGVKGAVEVLEAAGIRCTPLPVACAYHSPLVAPARDRLADVIEAARFSAPETAVYSNTSAAPYPRDPEQIAALLARHLVEPVDFAAEVEAMYEEGARIFIEAGPRNVLTGLIAQILGVRPHLAIATDSGGPPLVELVSLLGRLFTHGVDIDLDRVFVRRTEAGLSLEALARRSTPVPSPTTWMVNGGRARPLSVRPEPAKVFAPLPVQIPAPMPLPDAGDNATVMAQFQGVMNRFLDVQRTVMLSYLAGADAAVTPEQQSLFPASLEPPHAEPLREPAITVLRKEPTPAGKSIKDQLLDLVSERTGYPIDSLDLNANLEADLGIDSIKRVEILVGFQKLIDARGESGHRDMEQFTGAKTLQAILDRIEKPIAKKIEEQSTPRFVPVREEARCQLLPLKPSSLIVVTDDQGGVARLVTEALRAKGHRCALVRVGVSEREGNGEWCVEDAADARQVRQFVSALSSREGPIDGFVHLLPLRRVPDFDSLTLESWQRRHTLDAKSLFHFLQAAQRDLKSAGGEDRRVIAATAMGGDLGHAGTVRVGYPGHGAITGLMKTVAVEWPETRLRVVDFDPGEDIATIANCVMRELESESPHMAVGYQASRRRCVRTNADELAEGGVTGVELNSDSVVLVTGGARGITAEIACDLAKRYRPTLLLVGNSPQPEETEQMDTAGLATARELKAAVAERIRARGGSALPARIESEYQALLRSREIRANMEAMRKAGAAVHYYQQDVRDEDGFGALIDRLYREKGRIDVAIHGAGIIQDKLFAEKSSESFDLVFHTKVDSAFILARKLRPETLRALVFFSSVAGAFGSRGQCDYTAANDVLNKLAVHLDRQWQARVVALNWGPWSGAGMVSRAVGDQFERSGVKLVSPAAGCAAFDRELRFGRKGQPEVVLGWGPWSTRPECEMVSAEPVAAAMHASPSI